MIQKKLKSILWLFVISFTSVNAQDFNKKYFKFILSNLTSDYFSGRGYTENGMNKSALFLENEYKTNELKSYREDYFQTYSYPINIVNSAELIINGEKLKYGKDFIVKASSRSVTNNYKLPFYIFDVNKYKESFQSKNETRKFIENDNELQKNKNIILPPLGIAQDSIKQYYKSWANIYERDNNEGRAIFRFTSDKLVSSLSQRQSNISEFIISEKFFNKKIDSFSINSTFEKNFTAKNLIGFIEGKNNDSTIVITAHYDHLGKVGQTIFPGASDNASGVAMMMSLIDYYKKNTPKYRIVFIAFSGEEAGLLGSDYYVKNPLFPLSQIKFLVNLDIMGAGEDGIQIVNGKIFKDQFQEIERINKEKKYLKEIKTRGESCNSDHCPFYENGVPSFFIYTLGGKGYYHEPDDTMQNLNLNYSENVFNVLKSFINYL